MATPASAAAMLPPADRENFLAAVARELAGHEVGPGAEHRAVAVAFRAFFKPPEIPQVPSRWQRRRPAFEQASKAATEPPIARTRGGAL
jgi:hypothetical protein